ncbi:conserved protein of unknown function [Tenacibaculum sp. 190524A02b]|uniref:WG repeat-containing protein n=1 Tax=Tenacibaculum vairaonense TaxID=3137860 RepID=UPI0032B2D723
MRKNEMNRILTIFIALVVFGCQQPHNKKTKNYPNGLFPIKEYGKWGFINSKGNNVITCQFDEVGEFSEGLAGVLIDSTWGFIDITGKIVIEPKFYSTAKFSDGLCNVKIKTDSNLQNAFIRKDGSIAFKSEHKNISSFANGRATLKINNEVCVIDTLGKTVFNTHYPYGGGAPLQDGIVHVWSGDSTKYFDRGGNLLLHLDGMGHDSFNQGIAKIRKDNKTVYINKKGEVVIRPEKPDLTYFEFSDGLAQATISGSNHKSGFINKKGKIVIPIVYSEINNFKEGLAAFRDSIYYGFINKRGETVIEPQFEHIGYIGFKNGLCEVKKDGQWGYINHSAEFVWKSQKDVQYKKLDLTKWQLDTLEINTPMYGGIYAGYDNKPRKANFSINDDFYLKVDTSDITVFADKYLGCKIYLINGTNSTIKIPAQDHRIKIIQQALNEKNEWQDIENFINSWCGNSYHSIQILPKYYQIYTAPITKGDFSTSLRFRLELNDTIIHSNEYIGKINKEQLLKPEEKDKTGIAVWTN